MRIVAECRMTLAVIVCNSAMVWKTGCSSRDFNTMRQNANQVSCYSRGFLWGTQ